MATRKGPRGRLQAQRSVALGSDSGVFKKFDALVSTLGQMKK